MVAFLRIFHFYNDYVASGVSIVVNLLLLYAILKHTTNELKAYSKILLQTCFIDLFFTVIVFVTKPMIEFYDGRFFLMNGGFVERVPHPANFYLTMLWVIGFFFCITALPVQFFYRYILICKQQNLSNKFFVLLYFISFLVAFTYTVVAGLAFMPTTKSIEENKALLENDLWFDEFKRIPVFVASNVENPILITMLVYCLFIGGICYTLIIGFNMAIWKKLSSNQANMSTKTKTIQRQLNYALIVQAITPLLTAILPTSITCASLFLRLDMSGVGLPIMCAVGWITVINPLSALIFIGPYRKGVLRRLRLVNGLKSEYSRTTGSKVAPSQNPLPPISATNASISVMDTIG